MDKNIITAIYIVALVATVVVLDVTFFRHRFWERLLVNVGTVLIYAAFYLAFVKHR